MVTLVVMIPYHENGISDSSAINGGSRLTVPEQWSLAAVGMQERYRHHSQAAFCFHQRDIPPWLASTDWVGSIYKKGVRMPRFGSPKHSQKFLMVRTNAMMINGNATIHQEFL